MAQSFFLEPTTGETHPLDWEGYLGVESLWNHRNFWVNMQDCSQGVKVYIESFQLSLSIFITQSFCVLCIECALPILTYHQLYTVHLDLQGFHPPPPSPPSLPLLLQTMQYDLGDATKWEFFFPNVEKPLLVVPGEEIEEGEEGEEEKVSEKNTVTGGQHTHTHTHTHIYTHIHTQQGRGGGVETRL